MKKFALVVPLSEELKRVALVEKLGLGPSFVAGKIHFPGGPVGENESPEHCVVRALREETGLRVDASDLVRIAYQHKKDQFELTVFAVRVPNFDAEGTVKDEVELTYTLDALRASVAANPDRYAGDVLQYVELALMEFHEFA
ncbi:NUDIX hydrolase [Paraburkholderia sp. EG287A]|uniref:NUDIX hydrolase n=1 Tax=Paraburkholderia sp. EG287A TaxID=3237012 RepID=UPI0034D1DA94